MSNDVDKKLDDMHILLTIFKRKYVQLGNNKWKLDKNDRIQEIRKNYK